MFTYYIDVIGLHVYIHVDVQKDAEGEVGCEAYPDNAETTSEDITDVRVCRGIVARATGTV